MSGLARKRSPPSSAIPEGVPIRSYLICPVRGKDRCVFSDVVARLEANGYLVHWPHRDTDQCDDTGFRICSENAAAIAAADVVHVIWDGHSQGCLFDLGIAFALRKPIIPLELPVPTEGKSFQNMIQEWARRLPARTTNSS
jgi:nucleoside 2-deoxyribosyltransferase